MSTQRLHKYMYLVTVYTTDGNTSPDGFSEAVEALTPFKDYRHITCELQDRAACPESRDIDAPAMPAYPTGESRGSRAELDYFSRSDAWRDAVTAAVRAWPVAGNELARLTAHDLDCRCDTMSGSHIDWAFHTLCSLRRECKDEMDRHATTLAAVKP
jgi:hypothetical protein